MHCFFNSGGGDRPEDVAGALNEATLLGWTAANKVIFHIADAPPHGIAPIMEF